METSELLEVIARGEDGKHQFKANINNGNALAAEIVAFSNSGGGQMFIGVNDDGSLSGLGADHLRGEIGLNQLIPNVATNQVKPAVNVSTENIKLPGGLVVVVTIQDGISKPYFDNSGIIWVKSGSDKRKVTSREEIQRMFQSAGLLHGDEVPANGISVADVDLEYFSRFYIKEYNEEIDATGLPLSQLFENMNLAKDGVLNIAGALMFAKAPNIRLPAFTVKAVAFPGTDITDSEYLDSKDINGKISDIFQKTMSFLSANTKAIQSDQGFNSTGQAEIPRETLEELIVNALIHRDYFVTSPVKVLVFRNRIEIISPGHLPNNLTVQNILNGNSNIRNPVLVSFATKLLPYRGIGSGIRRALRHYPAIDFMDDRDGNQFIVRIWRTGNS
jgi:ATP-dependent DNA helicase RecG